MARKTKSSLFSKKYVRHPAKTQFKDKLHHNFVRALKGFLKLYTQAWREEGSNQYHDFIYSKFLAFSRIFWNLLIKVIVITSGDNEYIYLVNFLRFHEIFEITPLLKYKKGFFYATAQ